MALSLNVTPDTGSNGSDRYTSGDALHRLVLSGSADKRTSVIITYANPADGSLVSLTAAVGSNGRYSITTPSLVDGNYQFTVTEVNAQGATIARLTPLTTWTIDTSTNVNFSGTASIANATGVQLTGLAEAFDTVQVTYRNASGSLVTLGTATADSSGRWVLTKSLVAGNYSFTATATDRAGNVATAAAGVTVYGVPVERVATIVVAGDNIVNLAESSQLAMPVRVTLTAALLNGDRVVVISGGLRYDATPDPTDATGRTFIAQVPSAQAGGTLSARVENPFGAASTALNQPYIVDKVAPAVPVLDLGTGVANGATAAEATQIGGVVRVTAASDASVTVTFTSATATVTKTLAGTGVATAVVLSANELALLGQGAVSVTATATDAGGNVSASSNTGFVLDTLGPIAPTLALGAGVVGGATAAEATQAGGVITVNAEAGAAGTVTFTNGAATVSKNFTGTGAPSAVALTASDMAALGDGTISVSAMATDTAGNVSAAGTTSFVLDSAAPGPPALALGAGVADGATAAEATQAGGVVTVNAESGAAGTVTFTHGAATVSKNFTGTGAATAVILTASDLAALGDGTISVSATASDAAGNVSAVGATSFVLDSTAPGAPALALGAGVADGATAAEATQAGGVVTVNAESGAAGTVTFTNGAATVSKNFTGNGAATAIILTASDLAALGDGTISVSATASDAAGNVSAAGTTSFLLETTAPSAPTLALGTGVADGATAAEASQPGGVVTVAGEAGTSIAVTFSGPLGEVYKSIAGTGGLAGVSLTQADLAILGDGLVNVSAAASNGAGGVGPAALSSFTLDTLAPAAPTLVIKNDAGTAVALSNHPTLHLSGSAESGSTVTVTWTGPGGASAMLGTAIAGGTGLWALDTGSLPDGNHAFAAIATDAAGNTGPSSGGAVLVDTTAPQSSVNTVSVAGNNVIESAEAAQSTVPVSIKLSTALASGESVLVTSGSTTTSATLDLSDPTGKTYLANIASPQAAGSLDVRLQDGAGNATPAFTQAYSFDSTVSPPKWDHVVIIFEENKSFSQVIGNNQAPYLNSLASQGLLFTNFNAALHPSQPNYLITFSGSPQGVVDGHSYLFNVPTLAGELVDAGYSFTGFAETNAGERHMPWLTFVESRNMGQNLSAFPTDFNDLPTLSIVVPHDDHNMHDGTIAAGDAWLQDKLSAYAEWAKTNNSLLIVTFDEGSWDTVDGNRVATVIVGDGIIPGSTSDQAMTHYGLLHTIQSIYGLPALADSADTPVIEFPGLPALNNAPESDNDAFYALTNTTLNVGAGVGVLNNDTDHDGDALSAVLLNGPAHGTLQLNADGSFSYSPNAGYVGADSFTYRATDGKNASAVATASLFTANTAPIVASFQQGVGGYTGAVDTMIRGAAPTTTYDKYTELNVDSITPTGSTTSSQALLKYANLFGSGPGQIPLGSTIISATITFQTTDWGSGADLHRMLVPWAANSTWNSTVNGIQIDGTDALAAIDAHIGPVAVNGPISADVSSSVRAWANGAANNGWAMTPLGDDGWYFSSSESAGNAPRLSVVYVAPDANRAPVATGESYSVAKNASLTVSASNGVLINDVDFDGDALTALLVGGPAHGTVQLNSNGAFVYTPQANYAGTDSFTYTANDALHASDATTVNLTVGTLTQFSVTVQQGRNGYAGTVDTYLRQSAPDTRSGTLTVLHLDSDDPGGTALWNEGLLRFDNLVGAGANQVPLGAHILSATLALQTTDTGDGGEFHQMLRAWTVNDTWNTFGGGIQADGTEAKALIAANTGRVGSLGQTSISVTSSVQDWVNGEANNGWGILPLGADGWRFSSSEGTTAPALTIVYELYM